jgi:hypothetical protein
MFRTTSAQSCMTAATLVTSSGYLTRPSRTRGRHRKQPPPRRLLLRRRLAFGGSAVLLAALVASVGAVVKRATHEPVSLPLARPSTTIASSPPKPPLNHSARQSLGPRPLWRSMTGASSTPTRDATEPRRPSQSAGHRDHWWRSVETPTVATAIYLDPSDDAVLKTSARTTPTHEFIAQNASVTYSISPAGLLVTAGGGDQAGA